MTEKEFWVFLDTAIANKGRLSQVFLSRDSKHQSISENGRYIGGHSVLFNGHDGLPEDRIKEIAALLFDPSVSRQTKEAILTILAHYPKRCAVEILREYARKPDKELEYFAKTALWECRLWNK